MKIQLLFTACGLLCITLAFAQPADEDYVRADTMHKFNDLVYNAYPEIRWIDSTNTFGYSVKTREGNQYYIVDAEKQKRKPAFDKVKLCKGLNEASGKEYKAEKLNLNRLRFIDGGKKISFELDGTRWECDLKKYKFEKKERERTEREDRYWGDTSGQFESEPKTSPDSTKVAFIREYNLWVKDVETVKEEQLSFDGSSGEFYSGHIEWSPDSKKIAVTKVRINEKTYFYIVESSPDDQVQPKLHKKEYLKPGDALPIQKPCLFDIENRKQIPVDSQPFEHQYSLENLKWWPDSKAYTFEFNQRGHQLYQVVEVDAETGNTKVLIEEKSETFVEYSGKHYRYDIDSTKEIIWMSERDGWNHLYLVDAETAQVKNQITKGEWVVRSVVHVDEDDRTVLFQGSGRNPGEDPYFIHYYRVNFDGSYLVDLTPEPMNHRAEFSDDYIYFTDTYSTVNTPPLTVLKSTSNGEVTMEIEKADITDLLAAGWKKPEAFVAKARDGITDIWGNIYYPTNFDSTKSYPIIEYIYAGPQGSFAQKSFRAFNYPFSGLAELGFIIVQMDGMGTSDRSKAFHDVCYKNLKDAGFPDRILWIKAAAEKHSFMDTTRVGLFGGSAGGQNSTGGVLFHPGFYKAAVSACGCHDNRMDKMWWNEQWMGYPLEKHYEESSNVVNASKLEGDLMLIVGEMDDNVDPASTMQVVDALIKAKKEFELVMLPGTNHTLGGDYGERKRRDFFVKSFYNQLPPKWNLK
ncbi:MAG: DPP IV N-terminal domain-containing protein [Prolixibacteraceae bacterium]|nr:DPP IV N-terminal domain-containing protein [Prolixibacteraceae bacterium]